MNATYYGTPPGTVFVIYEDGRRGPLPKRFDLANHSPDGFAWGYGGSGPSQLALALCAHALGDDERAVRLYHPFKWLHVSRWDTDASWRMTSDQIAEACARLERKEGAA